MLWKCPNWSIGKSGWGEGKSKILKLEGYTSALFIMCLQSLPSLPNE